MKVGDKVSIKGGGCGHIVHIEEYPNSVMSVTLRRRDGSYWFFSPDELRPFVEPKKRKVRR